MVSGHLLVDNGLQVLSGYMLDSDWTRMKNLFNNNTLNMKLLKNIITYIVYVKQCKSKPLG